MWNNKALDQSTPSTLPLFSCLTKYVKLAIVFLFPGFFSGLHTTSSLDCSLGSNVSTPLTPNPACPYAYYPFPAPQSTASLLSSPSFTSSCHLELFLSVFPELAPVPGGFSDHSCFWEALGAVGGKSHQSRTVPRTSVQPGHSPGEPPALPSLLSTHSRPCLKSPQFNPSNHHPLETPWAIEGLGG